MAGRKKNSLGHVTHWIEKVLEAECPIHLDGALPVMPYYEYTPEYDSHRFLTRVQYFPLQRDNSSYTVIPVVQRS